MGHDTTDEIAQPSGKILDWRKGETEAVPGKTMPNFSLVKRDYPNVYQKMTTIGPDLKQGYGMKGVKLPGAKVYDELKERLGVSKREGLGKGHPDLYSDIKAAETILLMSGATNGRRAVEGWKSMEEKPARTYQILPKDMRKHPIHWLISLHSRVRRFQHRFGAVWRKTGAGTLHSR